MNRAYSLLEIKAVDEDERLIEGIATTPKTDRMGDIVESDGAEFTLPIPLLWQHDAGRPIGHVIEAKVTAEGIRIKARIERESDPGALKDLLDLAWGAIKKKLVRGLSIGFNALEWSDIKDTYGRRFTKWDWLELSAVTIPANAGASIQTVKSFDIGLPASSGTKAVPVVRLDTKPGASGSKTNTNPKPEEGSMDTATQIKQFEDTRATKSTRMGEIMKAAGENGSTLDAAQEEEYDTLAGEVKSIDAHLKRLRDFESAQAATATPITAKTGSNPEDASAARSGAPMIVKSVKNEEPGIGFTKFALAMYAGKGDVSSAKAFAEHAFGNDTRLQNVMKAAVAAGTTTDPAWAGNLVDYQNLSSEFVEFLRPRTILGQLGQGAVPGLRRVPFNVRIPGKTAKGRAQWVGEGYRKPVTKSGYDAAELKWAKIAAISVVTEELARFSDPSIQLLVRDDLSEAVIERMDEDFVDPAKAAGTGASLSPASITNGVTPTAATGDVDADIAALWATADATDLPVSSAVYITDSATARQLVRRKNPLGNREYPNVTMSGGNIDGVPLVVSNYVPAGTFILAFTSEIYLADDGIVTVDMSREATIIMDDDATATPTLAQIQSMFQTNQLAIRAERYVNWKKRRPQAVAYLSGVDWTPTAPVDAGDNG